MKSANFFILLLYCTKRRFSEIKPKRIEYILEWNLLEKKCKTAFFCTFFILQVYFTILCYINFWALKHHFIENLKLILKENQIMIHNWPMIISHSLCLSLYKRWFSVITINQKCFYSPNSIYKVYLTALKNSKLNWNG